MRIMPKGKTSNLYMFNVEHILFVKNVLLSLIYTTVVLIAFKSL
jgi:hypothetical protein